MTQAISHSDMQSLLEDCCIDVVIPAAGVGKRMGADKPKQYLEINGVSILAHTVSRMCELSYVRHVILAISENDEYYQSLKNQAPFNNPKVKTVIGGKERADSVLAGINSIESSANTWVLVHDGARPNISSDDVNNLVYQALVNKSGAILASPVKDTIKQQVSHAQGPNVERSIVERTVPRQNLWHALTPQFFPVEQLSFALEKGLKEQAVITDEASAIEYIGESVLLLEGRSDNIKVTQPEDLALITFYLQSS